MEIHVNFFRQYVQNGFFKLAKIASKSNPSDVCTKGYSTRAAFREAADHFIRTLPFRYRPTSEAG